LAAHFNAVRAFGKRYWPMVTKGDEAQLNGPRPKRGIDNAPVHQIPHDYMQFGLTGL
jgi:hypothetical protein